MKKIVIIFIILLSHLQSDAQYQVERYDSSYYISYRDKLTLGTLVAKKNTAFKLNAKDADNPLRYFSNSPARFGFSVDHDFLALSGTIGIGGADPSYSKDKGKTKQLNLQVSFIGRKVLADIYVQKYKGLYSNLIEAGFANSSNFYVRPDIQTALYGTTITLIKNQRKFSAQAPFLLDARQKKSAGSLLYGGEFYYGTAKGDSAFIPSNLEGKYKDATTSKINYISFGPGIGYGYTYVLKEHFFVTAMPSFNADVSYVKEWDAAGKLQSNWKFNPNLKAKAAIGYNDEKWGVALSYVSNRLFFNGAETDTRYLNYNDNYKLMYVRRINAGKTIPKITGFAKKIINKVGLGFLVN